MGMANERDDRYKQIRIMVNPSPTSCTSSISVVARTSVRGSNHDRVLVRRDIGVDLGQLETPEMLRQVGELLVAEAFRRANPAPQAPHDPDPFYRRV